MDLKEAEIKYNYKIIGSINSLWELKKNKICLNYKHRELFFTFIY
jgi:hypothetical protein